MTELSAPARLLNERPRHFWARVIAVFIAKGWSPPKPDERMVEAVTMDIQRITRTRGFWGGRSVQPTLALTGAETRALILAADGYSVIESAAAVGIQPDTLRQQRKAVIARLGARNMPHAVALAMRQGLLS